MACYLYRYHLVSSLSTISLLVPSPMCTLDLPLNAGIQISTNVLLFNSAAAEKKKKRGKEKEKPNQTHSKTATTAEIPAFQYEVLTQSLRFSGKKAPWHPISPQQSLPLRLPLPEGKPSPYLADLEIIRS